MKFGLGKDQRLKNSEEISRLFETKQLIKEFPFILYYDLLNRKTGAIQIAFGMSRRKGGNAVKRNRAKRVMREAYRKSQYTIQEDCIPEGRKLALMLIYTGEKLPELSEAEEKIKLLLNRLNKILKA